MPRYTGPFEIIEVVGNGVYRLKKGDKNIKACANAINLKLFNRDLGFAETAETEEKCETEKDKQRTESEEKQESESEEKIACAEMVAQGSKLDTR